MSTFDLAWALLKSVDFRDIAPMPTRYIMHPDAVRYGETKPRRMTSPFKEMYEQQPKREQAYMEETYIPELQAMLERQAMIQAMKNQQLPDEQMQNFATREMLRNRSGATGEMYNLPEYIAASGPYVS